MRYFLRFSLIKDVIINDPYNPPDWINKVLPEKFIYSKAQFSLNSFKYNRCKPSIVEQNWNEPYFENSDYILFIGGSVYYRLSEKDTPGRYVPTPSEVFKILIESKGKIHKRLKGNFYLVLYNKISCTVEVTSAPFAIYPAWYTVHKGVLYVSNIIESLIKIRESIDFDSRGLYEFSLFDHCLKDRTIYKNIFLLEGGKTLSFDNSNIKKQDDYDISSWFNPNPSKKSDSIEKIDYILKRHIGEFTKSSELYTSALTGGYDSRLNLSYIPSSDYTRMQTLSYGKSGSNQLKIPSLIANKLGFTHNGAILGNDFVRDYNKYGLEAIVYSGGVTPFFRAMYPYAYSKAANFSKSFMLGQCDMIRPLSMSQPAGAIYNDYNWNVFFGEGKSQFHRIATDHKLNSYIDYDIIKDINPDEIYDDIVNEHISPYNHLDIRTKFWFFLYKESMLKFWHTECHLVDVFVNDFISFADLDFIEALTASKYCGVYKGLFEKSNLKRLGAHDLYVDLMTLNNNKLNNIISDRFYQPKWYKYLPFGYIPMAIGKLNQLKYLKKGNDTFEGNIWHDPFLQEHQEKLLNKESFIDLNKKPYQSEINYRRNRFVSLKIWLSLLR